MSMLHAVTRDISDIPDSSLVSIIEAIVPFVDYIQLREKSRSSKSLGLLIESVLERDIPVEKLIINDRADIAKAFGIPRTHLTEKSLSLSKMQDAFPEMKFGRSFHSISAITREIAAYDYGYLGHIFRTSEKSYPALGMEALREASKEAKERGGKLIAIGGIDVDTIGQVLPYASGAAVMSALFPVVNYQFDVDRGLRRAKALREMIDQSYQ